MGLLTAAGLFISSGGAAQAASCQFNLGFKTLREMAPTTIGDCAGDQAYGANGDAQQMTNKGMLVWRKSDNWTAFTDGFRTWINGPQGLQQRLNTQLFSWEKAAPA